MSHTLDLSADVIDLTAAICDIPSVSLQEQPLADAIEAALRPLGHLYLTRVQNSIVARTGSAAPSGSSSPGTLTPSRSPPTRRTCRPPASPAPTARSSRAAAAST